MVTGVYSVHQSQFVWKSIPDGLNLILKSREYLTNHRIKLLAGQAHDLFDRTIMGPRILVRSPGGEGIIDVGNGADPGAQWNLITSKTVGIPAADPPLVMMQSDP